MDEIEIEIEIPDEIYKRAIKLAEKLNISFDEVCAQGVRKLAEEHLKQTDKNT